MKSNSVLSLCKLLVALMAMMLCGHVHAVASKDIVRTDVSPDEQQSFARSKKVALVVGISDYASESGLRALDYAHRDALALAAVLRRQGYTVKTLITPPAWAVVEDKTARSRPVLGRDIVHWVEQLGKTLSASEGTFLFSFSGHGWSPDNKANYLATYDATLGELAKTGVSVEAISQAMAKTGAKRRVLLIDACRNNPQSAAKGAVANTNFAKFSAARGEAILYSTESGTSSFETSALDGGHGVFSYFVVKGLSGAAASPDGAVGFRELADYVEAAVEEYSVGALPAVQSPFKGGDSRGNFLLAANSVIFNEPAKPDLAATTGEVEVRSMPTGAAVEIGGKAMGQTPVQLRLAEGEVAIAVRKTGYQTASERIRVRNDKTQVVTLLMEAVVTTGGLEVTSDPPGAVWYLDGARMGTTPDTATGVSPGRHTVQAQREGYERSEQPVTVEVGRTQGVNLQLRAKPAPMAALKPGQSYRDRLKDGSQGPELVVIPAGSFDMGSLPSEAGHEDDEGPVHRVTHSKPFALGKYEVTVGEFRKFASGTNYQTDAERDYASVKGCFAWLASEGKWDWRVGTSWKSPGYAQKDDHPVVCVSHNDVEKYLVWLNEQTGKRYRLPSEAEWVAAGQCCSI